jgi:hypothetical protein
MVTPTDADGRCLFCNRTMRDVVRDYGLVDVEIDPRLEALKALRDRLEDKQ